MYLHTYIHTYIHTESGPGGREEARQGDGSSGTQEDSGCPPETDSGAGEEDGRGEKLATIISYCLASFPNLLRVFPLSCS